MIAVSGLMLFHVPCLQRRLELNGESNLVADARPSGIDCLSTDACPARADNV